MKDNIKYLFLAFAFFYGSQSIAQNYATPMDGNTLYKACTNIQAGGGSIICSWYVAGVMDVLNGEEMANKNHLRFYCIPPGVVYEQTTDIFIQYLKKHPEKRQLRASTLLIESLQEAFPCR